MLKLSVIVPVYNTEKYLPACLDSILSQSYQNLELICVDDGSKDNSIDILKNYAQKDPRVIVKSKVNGGQSSARNLGLDIATGDYISFIDSDDFLSPGMYDELVSLMEEDGSDLSGCGIRTIYEKPDRQQIFDNDYLKIRLGRNIEVSSDIFDKVDLSCANKLFKRSIIKNSSLKFPEGLWYEDSGFLWCYLSICKKISFTSNIYYNYVRYSESTMGKSRSGLSLKVLDYIEVASFISIFLSNQRLFQKFKKAFFNYLADSFWFCLKYLPWKKKHLSIQRILNLVNKEPLKVEIGFWKFTYVFCTRIKFKIVRKLKREFRHFSNGRD